MMVRFLIGLLLILLIGTTSWFLFFRNEPVEKVSKEGSIIFFGNSLTAGAGAGEGEDFPSVVARKLNLTNVINAGVPGDTTETALARLQTDVLGYNPSIVIVELSGNDFLRGVSVEKTIENLDVITKQIKQTGSQIILVNINFPKNADDYKNGFKKISEKYNTPVVWDILDGIVGNSSLMADSIHPNAAGYKIMADRIIKVLQPLIQ